MNLDELNHFLMFMALGNAFMYCVFRAVAETYEVKGVIILACIIFLIFILMCIFGDPSPIDLMFNSHSEKK